MNRRLLWVFFALWPSGIALGSNTSSKHLASEQVLDYSSDVDLLAEAESLMEDFASAREHFPDRFAFFVRGQRWLSSERRGVQRTETVFLGAVDESSIGNPVGSHHYVAIGTRILDSIGEPQSGANNWLGVVGWNQWLRVGGDSYFRMGLDDKNDSKAKLEIDSDDRMFGRLASGTVDFFNVPVSLAGALNSQRVPRTFLHKYLRGGEVVRAAKTKKKVVGVWEIDGKPGAIVAVTFETATRMPISVAWRSRQSADQDIDELLNSGHVLSVIQTDWGEHESVMVPRKITVNYASQSKLRRMEEAEYYLEWRFDNQVVDGAIPATNDEKWTESLRAVFVDEFSLPYDEYVAGRSKRDL